MKINISEKAVSQLNKMIEEKRVNKNVRVYISGVGWGGPTFGLVLEEPKEDDIIEKSGDINFIFAPEMQDNFTSIHIDYGSGFLSRGFSINGSRG